MKRELFNKQAKLLRVLFFLLFCTSINAQAPEKMTYQAIVRDQNGALMVNTTIGVQVMITKDGFLPVTVYTETHTATSNANGLITLEVGNGTVVNGDFSTIDWGNGSYNLVTNFDLSGGINYSLLGTSKLLSVPYALYAKNAGNSMIQGNTSGDLLYWNNNQWNILPAGTNGQVLIFNNGAPEWGSILPPAGIPSVSTSAPYNVLFASASCGAYVTSDGGSPVIERGICMNTSGSPTVADVMVSSGSGPGSYSGNFSNLALNTTYYLRAYATNNVGTAYGNEVSFTTLNTPTLTTDSTINLHYFSTTIASTLVSDGGLNLSTKGICWSKNPNPTLSDSVVTSNLGTGPYNCQITGLRPMTTYYVRAFATNPAGTAYGNQLSFTTLNNTNSFVDDRDNQGYNTVILGNQEWMSENLRYLPEVVGPASGSDTLPYYYVYNYNGISPLAARMTSEYQTYGVLYNWEAALTACPSSWHLPSENEFYILQNYLIANGYNYDGTFSGNKIAKAMADSTFWAVSNVTGDIGKNLSQNNSSGFSARPAGYRNNSSGNFLQLQSEIRFQTSTPDYGGNGPRTFLLRYDDENLTYYTTPYNSGISVRCVKN
ncbi:MAG: fibrobacter succinogenes major paralogous domain-containing protein [Bacteroidales bacterium]|nr:fibrobacter succinogenes major paralogous domain-containing protein [Bacteroidales bacterium]